MNIRSVKFKRNKSNDNQNNNNNNSQDISFSSMNSFNSMSNTNYDNNIEYYIENKNIKLDNNNISPLPTSYSDINYNKTFRVSNTLNSRRPVNNIMQKNQKSCNNKFSFNFNKDQDNIKNFIKDKDKIAHWLSNKRLFKEPHRNKTCIDLNLIKLINSNNINSSINKESNNNEERIISKENIRNNSVIKNQLDLFSSLSSNRKNKIIKTNNKENVNKNNEIEEDIIEVKKRAYSVYDLNNINATANTLFDNNSDNKINCDKQNNEVSTNIDILETKKHKSLSNMLGLKNSSNINILKSMLMKSISTVESKTLKKKDNIVEELIKEFKIESNTNENNNNNFNSNSNSNRKSNRNSNRNIISKAQMNFANLSCKPDISGINLTNKSKKNNSSNKIKHERNCFKIMNLLKLIPGFRKYIHYNSITDDALIKACNHFIYLSIKSGKYVFREGDDPDSFYCLLNGRIEINKNSINFNKFNVLTQKLNKINSDDEINYNSKDKSINEDCKGNSNSTYNDNSSCDENAIRNDTEAILYNSKEKVDKPHKNEMMHNNEEIRVPSTKDNFQSGNKHDDNVENKENRNNAIKYIDNREDSSNNIMKIKELITTNKSSYDTSLIQSKLNSSNTICKTPRNTSDVNNLENTSINIYTSTSKTNETVNKVQFKENIFKKIIMKNKKKDSIKEANSDISIINNINDINKIDSSYIKPNKTIESQSNVPLPNKKQLIRKFFNMVSIHKMLKINERIKILNSGECFGDYGLLDNTKRTANAITLTNCHLIKIKKSVFDLYFKKCLKRAETKNREFIKSVIPPIQKVNETTFDWFFRSIIITHYDKNELIYDKNSPCEYFYIILNGECMSKSNISNNTNTNSSKVNSTLLHTKGDIVGLECLSHILQTIKADSNIAELLNQEFIEQYKFSNKDKSNIEYKNELKAYSEISSVIKIPVFDLKDTKLINVLVFLKNLETKKEDFRKNFISGINSINHKRNNKENVTSNICSYQVSSVIKDNGINIVDKVKSEKAFDRVSGSNKVDNLQRYIDKEIDRVFKSRYDKQLASKKGLLYLPEYKDYTSGDKNTLIDDNTNNTNAVMNTIEKTEVIKDNKENKDFNDCSLFSSPMKQHSNYNSYFNNNTNKKFNSTNFNNNLIDKDDSDKKNNLFTISESISKFVNSHDRYYNSIADIKNKDNNKIDIQEAKNYSSPHKSLNPNICDIDKNNNNINTFYKHTKGSFSENIIDKSKYLIIKSPLKLVSFPNFKSQYKNTNIKSPYNNTNINNNYYQTITSSKDNNNLKDIESQRNIKSKENTKSPIRNIKDKGFELKSIYLLNKQSLQSNPLISSTQRLKLNKTKQYIEEKAQTLFNPNNQGISFLRRLNTNLNYDRLVDMTIETEKKKLKQKQLKLLKSSKKLFNFNTEVIELNNTKRDLKRYFRNNSNAKDIRDNRDTIENGLFSATISNFIINTRNNIPGEDHIKGTCNSSNSKVNSKKCNAFYYRNRNRINMKLNSDNAINFIKFKEDENSKDALNENSNKNMISDTCLKYLSSHLITKVNSMHNTKDNELLNTENRIRYSNDVNTINTETVKRLQTTNSSYNFNYSNHHFKNQSSIHTIMNSNINSCDNTHINNNNCINSINISSLHPFPSNNFNSFSPVNSVRNILNSCINNKIYNDSVNNNDNKNSDSNGKACVVETIKSSNASTANTANTKTPYYKGYYNNPNSKVINRRNKSQIKEEIKDYFYNDKDKEGIYYNDTHIKNKNKLDYSSIFNTIISNKTKKVNNINIINNNNTNNNTQTSINNVNNIFSINNSINSNNLSKIANIGKKSIKDKNKISNNTNKTDLITEIKLKSAIFPGGSKIKRCLNNFYQSNIKINNTQTIKSNVTDVVDKQKIGNSGILIKNKKYKNTKLSNSTDFGLHINKNFCNDFEINKKKSDRKFKGNFNSGDYNIPLIVSLNDIIDKKNTKLIN